MKSSKTKSQVGRAHFHGTLLEGFITVTLVGINSGTMQTKYICQTFLSCTMISDNKRSLKKWQAISMHYCATAWKSALIFSFVSLNTQMAVPGDFSYTWTYESTARNQILRQSKYLVHARARVQTLMYGHAKAPFANTHRNTSIFFFFFILPFASFTRMWM